MIGNGLLEKIEDETKVVSMSLNDDAWRQQVPSSPGWYFIETDTPVPVLQKVGSPAGERHYNIPPKVRSSLALEKLDLCILPEKGSKYFIYSGEAKNLKSRSREHVAGHSKTGCLALANYPELHKYNWLFHYAVCNFGDHPNDSKLLRIFGEQLWRAKHGWPILCGK